MLFYFLHLYRHHVSYPHLSLLASTLFFSILPICDFPFARSRTSKLSESLKETPLIPEPHKYSDFFNEEPIFLLVFQVLLCLIDSQLKHYVGITLPKLLLQQPCQLENTYPQLFSQCLSRIVRVMVSLLPNDYIFYLFLHVQLVKWLSTPTCINKKILLQSFLRNVCSRPYLFHFLLSLCFYHLSCRSGMPTICCKVTNIFLISVYSNLFLHNSLLRGFFRPVWFGHIRCNLKCTYFHYFVYFYYTLLIKIYKNQQKMHIFLK